MKNSIFLNIIKWSIVLAFFTPLLVSNKFIFPFVFPKTSAFQILVEVMFFAWLILIIEKPEFRPARSKLIFTTAVFLAVVFFASLLGVDFQLSFWSSFERMTGIITLLHYFVYFLVLSSVLKTKKDWFLMFDFFIAASLLLSFFGLGQKLGLPGFVLSGKGRVASHHPFRPGSHPEEKPPAFIYASRYSWR